MENLWPKTFTDVNINEPPKDMLEQQAKFLETVTEGQVYAEVLEIESFDSSQRYLQHDFVYSFYIRAKYIEKYSYRVFLFYHDIPFFPVVFLLDDDIDQELGIETSKERKVNSFEKLNELLKHVFNSKKVKEIVGSLIRLSKYSD